MTTDAYQAAYAYLRDYRSATGRAPSARDVYAALGLTKRQFYAALRWLLAYRFLTRTLGEWRTARVNIRRCACGAEITPENVVTGTDSKGYRYQRRKCAACWHEQHAASQRRYARANPGYYTRLNRRLRQQARLDMNRSVAL